MAVDSETTEIRALQCRQSVREEIGFAGLRFNGRRDERPNRNAFTSLMTARRIIEACDDNLVRSHSSFGRLCFAQHVNHSQGQ